MSTGNSRARGGKQRGWPAVATAAGGLGVAAVVGYGLLTFQAESSGARTDAGGDRQYGLVADSSDPVPVSEVLATSSTAPVTVTGTVVDMGPTMGCWLVIDDGTGKVLVQTDPMAYVDQSVKGQTITATGQMTVLNGGMGFSGKQTALLTTGITVRG
jgi:hypothetical protein